MDFPVHPFSLFDRVSHLCCVFHKYSVGLGVRGADERQQFFHHGTSYNFDIMALLKTWSHSPMPSMDSTVAVGSASVKALIACPTQSVPARVDNAN